jgi:hypothetical protein
MGDGRQAVGLARVRDTVQNLERPLDRAAELPVDEESPSAK